MQGSLVERLGDPVLEGRAGLGNAGSEVDARDRQHLRKLMTVVRTCFDRAAIGEIWDELYPRVVATTGWLQTRTAIILLT